MTIMCIGLQFQLFSQNKNRKSEMMRSFRLLGLSPRLMDNLARMRLLIPTEIQQKTFHHLYNHSSALIMAETGSGKTLAYTLPVMSRLLDSPRDPVGQKFRSPRAVMIMPSDDLARQTFAFVEAMARDTSLKNHLLLDLNESAPKIPYNTDIFVTSMNSMSGLMSQHGSQLFASTETVVVDEADWVLGEGFPRKRDMIPPIDVISILKRLKYPDTHNPDNMFKKQFIFSCATLPRGPKSPLKFIQSTFHGIPFIHSANAHNKVSTLKEHWITLADSGAADSPAEITDKKNRELLDTIKESSDQTRIIVFANTIRSIETAYEFLKDSILTCPTLSARIGLHMIHGKVSPVDRERTLSFFTQNNDTYMAHNDKETIFDSKIHVLIAGDLVARGYDFCEISKIIQYDFPTNVVTYLHRIGRAARAGNSGEVINFITDPNSNLLKLIRGDGESIDPADDVYSTKYAKAFSRNKSLRKREQRKNKI